MAQSVAYAKPGLTSCRKSIADTVKDLELLRLSPDEYDTVSSMEEALESRIQKLKKENGTLNEGYERILNNLRQTRRDRRRLLRTYYQEAKNVLQELQAIFPQENYHFLAEASDYIKDIKHKKFVVFIAGETSAGKSSLINLLLNDQVLPTSIRQNTLTICEISYGENKEAVIHFAKAGMKPLKLEGSQFGTIAQYIEKPRDDKHWSKKMEIKIPNPLLKGGVVIVDSPGIGDSEDVNEISLEYLPQASAYIYVINSPNAGGLQEDRLLRIVREWINLYNHGEKRRPITYESALFVCNKWDEVERNCRDQREKEDLQKDIISKLKQKIPELDQESQVIQMSVRTATQVQQKLNVMSDDLNSLIDGIRRLVPLCIERKTEYFYWWISGHLTRLSDQVKSKMNAERRNRKERLKAREDVDVKLKKLKQDASISKAERALCDHVNRISECYLSYLQSDDVRRAFCTWTETDLPRIEDVKRRSDESLNKIYNTCIAQRLETYLQKQENEEELFKTAHDKLKALFRGISSEFEKDIRDIDQVLVGESMDEFITYTDKLRPPMDPRLKKFLALTGAIFMPIWFPIALTAGILSAPVAVWKVLRKKELKRDDCQALTELSTDYLQALTLHDVTIRVLKDFEDEKKLIVKVRRCYQALIDEYDQKCNDLTRSEDEKMRKEDVDKLSRLYAKLKTTNEKFMFDAIQSEIQVMNPPCQIDKWRLQQNSEKMLGKGSYGTVYEGTFSPAGRRKKSSVAVKQLNKCPLPSNVSSFLGEAAVLKQLKHKHIVRFYGVSMDVQEHKLISLALVFELCKASLKSYIFENENYVPWKTASATTVTFEWGNAILDALEYIHSKNIVHRDLKLDNVLISRHGNIKVADLGLASFTHRITGTRCGTPLYMAPEVREGNVYDSKADMYSFGLMMWEMWFGEMALVDLSSKSENNVKRLIEEKRHLGEGSLNPPPTTWVELMTSCWHSDPCERLTAKESLDLIEIV